MVKNTTLALQALHEALIAARNIGLENARVSALTDIVDMIEAVPLWIANAHIDYTNAIIDVFEQLSLEYPQCRLASRTAARLREE
jgi:hypothetical protein